MAQHHKYTIDDLENRFPFELNIYVDMLIDYLEQQEKDAESKGL